MDYVFTMAVVERLASLSLEPSTGSAVSISLFTDQQRESNSDMYRAKLTQGPSVPNTLLS